MKMEFHVASGDFVNAGKISSQIKQTLKQIGLQNELLRRMAVACYEAEINMIIHSEGGAIFLEILDEGQVKMTFQDQGPGIDDLEKALTPGFSTASEKAREFGFGAGMGLPNIKRVSDTFDISTSKKGTTLILGFELS